MGSQMMEEFLSKRNVEVRSEMEATRVDIAEHEVRLVGLRARLQGLEAEMAALELAAGRAPTVRPGKRTSIKKQILAILRTCQEPISPHDLFQEVQAGNPSLRRTSFSPQLSRLVQQGQVGITPDQRYHLTPVEQVPDR